MTIHPVLLYIWAGLFLSFMGLLVYRGQLTRYEDDQLFLEDETSIVRRNREQHERRLQQLSRLRPIFATCTVAAGLVTASVVSIYVYNAWQAIP